QRSRHEPKVVWNSPTYDLGKIEETNTGPKLACKVGTYFESVATSNTLQDEIISALYTRRDSCLGLTDLPRRKWLHTALKGTDPVYSGESRSAAVGITTMVMFRH